MLSEKEPGARRDATREALFISHASPEDNAFTLWLGAKLTALGYIVFADVLRLKGGDDWERILEDAIRNKAGKVLLVATPLGVQKQGVRNEITIAMQTAKKIGDANFIVPLRLAPFEPQLQIAHAQYLDFSKSWAAGLAELLALLEEHRIPKADSGYAVLWQGAQLKDARTIGAGPERLISNWLAIESSPERIRFYDFKGGISPVAASVKVVGFAKLPPKSDVSDFLKGASAAQLEQLVADAPLWAPRTAETSQHTGGWRRTIVAASELRLKALEPVKYVLPDYIPEGVTVFAGKPKIGKSWLLYDLCLASAADRFVLGNIKPAQGDVLYLALEDSQRRLQRRLLKLWPQGNWPSRLSLTTEWRRADAGGVSDLAEWCDAAEKPVLIVIDTLEKFRPLAKAHSSAYTTDYAALADLHKLAHQKGIAVVVVHHVRKMEADDPFDMVSGTNGLTGAADTLLVLRRQSGNVTLYSRGRDIEERETACQFDKGSCRWTFLGEASEVHTSGERAAILTALRPVGEAGMHTLEIMVATGRRDRNGVDQLLYKMTRDGELVRVKRGVYAIAGKTDKKERSRTQTSETVHELSNLIHLTDLTGDGRDSEPEH